MGATERAEYIAPTAFAFLRGSGSCAHRLAFFLSRVGGGFVTLNPLLKFADSVAEFTSNLTDAPNAKKKNNDEEKSYDRITNHIYSTLHLILFST